MRLSRATLFRLTAVAAVIAGIVIASPVRSEIADAVGGALGIRGGQIVPNNPANPANALVRDAVPALSAAQTSTAAQIVSEDADVARLLQGVPYEVAHEGPWMTARGAPRLIGAVLFVHLAHPADIAGPWPTAVYDEAEREFPPYAEKREEFTAKGVTSVLIEVDLTKGMVAGVVPNSYASIVR